jgi:hypothetical protein
VLTVPPTADAAAATSYWSVHSRPASGKPLCLTAGAVGAPVAASPCTGGADQDWAFVNGGGGQYVMSRGRAGGVLALTALTVGGTLVVRPLEASDRSQVFVAGDPVRAHQNHIRPRGAIGLCLQLRVGGAPRHVRLAPCGTASTGDQAWFSTFTGNH